MTMETTKNRILNEALNLFAKDGYEAVSVEQIANAVGIKAPSLYKHYKGKRDIFNSILERMNQLDTKRAKEYEMPEGKLNEEIETYQEMSLERIKAYSEALLLHWTDEKFSANFRKMLTLEQYRNPEMSKLYQQYLSNGPIKYMQEVFKTMEDKDADSFQLALEFYGPIYLLYSIYDGNSDKEQMVEHLSKHIDRFDKLLNR